RAENKVFEKLDEAERASLKARDLAQQLLTFSRGGAPIKTTISLGESLRDSASFALRGSNVRCEFSLPDNLWPADVDDGQINQVINNMVMNAEQAMPQGGVIVVHAENTIVGATHGLPLNEGKYIKIAIKDSGIGIAREHLPRIFEPYFTTKQKGSGLGLSTSYSIIKNHDGYVTAESEPGVGTNIYFYLPASEKEIPGKWAVGEPPPMGKGKILVMDDEEMVRNTVGEMLESMGYEVEFARDGADALEIYEEARESGKTFDVVIMDLTVPGGMGGKEAMSRLIEIDTDVRAIVSSGYSNDPIMAEFEKHGFSGVLAKPFKIKELCNALSEVLTKTDEFPS
ncbi:MAG: response regulator, partial [Thermodesulfobacteriota bacterium]|nr:response regulator [Thermodesulfobacteriota bacterium]